MSNIIADGEDQMDIQTGYFTRKTFTESSKDVDKYEATVTALIRSTRQLRNGRYWYLTTMALPAGVLFPAGSPDEYHWLVAPVVEMDSGQKDEYGGEDETRVAVEDAKKFQKFQEALVYLGML
tara:strand:- start:1083 stop:1451 length:369 start_codon:yes stop_codon:yes gene_type:complete